MHRSELETYLQESDKRSKLSDPEGRMRPLNSSRVQGRGKSREEGVRQGYRGEVSGGP